MLDNIFPLAVSLAVRQLIRATAQCKNDAKVSEEDVCLVSAWARREKKSSHLKKPKKTKVEIHWKKASERERESKTECAEAQKRKPKNEKLYV